MAYMYVPIATRSKAPQTSTWNNKGESNAVDTIVYSAGLMFRSYASHSIGDRQTKEPPDSHATFIERERQVDWRPAVQRFTTLDQVPRQTTPVPFAWHVHVMIRLLFPYVTGTPNIVYR